MAVFTLNWDNTLTLASPNTLAQRASYRRKDVGGAWITAGFTPANDMLKTAITALSPDLLVNVLYEFRVQAICTTNGPTTNSNGIREQIIFACIAPATSQSDVAATASISTVGLNITKVRFTLRKTSDNSIVGGPTTITVAGDLAQTTVTGLTASTSYYWQIELLATVNGVEVVSSAIDYLNAVCGPYSVTTAAPAACQAPEDLEVLANVA